MSSKEYSERIKAIRDHFNSVNLTKVDFCNSYWETYGFNTIERMKKCMTEANISVKERSKIFLDKDLNVKSEINTYDIHLLENFGILDSIGKEYTSYKLPELSLIHI